MISAKELKYVDVWARKTPMPGYEYSIAVLEEIEYCYNLFLKMYKDKQFSLIFSNAEEIEFSILDKNLCHMVGIDYSNLKDDFFKKYRKEVFNTEKTLTSFELVEAILKNKETVAQIDNDSQAKIKGIINYYRSSVKCAIFKKLCNFDNFNYAAINYVGDNDNLDYEKLKYLFMPSNEQITPYFLIGLKKDDSGEYVVNTLLALRDKDMAKYFDNQEVIIPTQILVTDQDVLRKLVASPEEKLQLIAMYRSITTTYNLPYRLNIFADYQEMLNEQALVKERKKYL